MEWPLTRREITQGKGITLDGNEIFFTFKWAMKQLGLGLFLPESGCIISLFSLLDVCLLSSSYSSSTFSCLHWGSACQGYIPSMRRGTIRLGKELLGGRISRRSRFSFFLSSSSTPPFFFPIITIIAMIAATAFLFSSFVFCLTGIPFSSFISLFLCFLYVRSLGLGIGFTVSWQNEIDKH
jgi:hypothetical protein